VEITILGSGTCVPSLKRGSSGLILRIGERILLFDSGTGTIERMLKRGITYLDLDLVLYTHTHPDHIADLVPLIFACKYGENPRRRDLPMDSKLTFRPSREYMGVGSNPICFKYL
jgi:ribonuclease BN (tRNA processing enzyme)